jgi:hypothetical protein
VANLSTTIATILADIVIRIPPAPATAPTMAEHIPNLRPGEFILLKEDNTSPFHWPTDVIIETHLGKNNSFRVDIFRNTKGIFKRP